MKLAMIDVETTGLDPAKGHRVIEFALQVVDVLPDDLHVVEAFEFKQKIDIHRHVWEPGAFKANGYFDGHPEWRDAPLVDTVEAKAGWARVVAILEG